MTDLQQYLDFMTAIAFKAGRLTLGYYQVGLRPEIKPDETPVTAADRAAEEFIRGAIQRKDFGMVSTKLVTSEGG